MIGISVVGFIFLLIFGASLSSGGDAKPRSSAEESANPELDEQLQLFEAERAQYYELAAVLEGNPVAPLVAEFKTMERLEARVAENKLNGSIFSAKTHVQEAQRLREQLEQRIAAAEQTRVNASGSLIESIVDSAGNGFIDVQWDAATACNASAQEGWRTVACVAKGDSFTIHFLADSEFSGDWERHMFAVHELAHIYQRADKSRFDDGSSDAIRLLEQGLFQGSEEAMADCYALTYYGEWTLEGGDSEIGYGYVCNESERQAIRDWAAAINAPMPG